MPGRIPQRSESPSHGSFSINFGDSMFELELVVWSIEMSYRPRAFRSDLNFEIERRFREAGIEWPRSRRDIRVSTPPALQGEERRADTEREQRRAEKANSWERIPRP